MYHKFPCQPPAGLFVVRAGPYLKSSILSYLLHTTLTLYTPQTEFLGLISTGDKYAGASRGNYALEGEFLWVLKDQIDQTWMDSYLNLQSMDGEEKDGGDDEPVSLSPPPARSHTCRSTIIGSAWHLSLRLAPVQSAAFQQN